MPVQVLSKFFTLLWVDYPVQLLFHFFLFLPEILFLIMTFRWSQRCNMHFLMTPMALFVLEIAVFFFVTSFTIAFTPWLLSKLKFVNYCWKVSEEFGGLFQQIFAGKCSLECILKLEVLLPQPHFLNGFTSNPRN